jgi:hypothetical protein
MVIRPSIELEELWNIESAFLLNWDDAVGTQIREIQEMLQRY